MKPPPELASLLPTGLKLDGELWSGRGCFSGFSSLSSIESSLASQSTSLRFHGTIPPGPEEGAASGQAFTRLDLRIFAVQ